MIKFKESVQGFYSMIRFKDSIRGFNSSIRLTLSTAEIFVVKININQSFF